jgi:hypothetical protein
MLVNRLPPQLQANVRTYNAAATLAELGRELRRDAAIADGGAAQSLTLLTAREDVLQRQYNELAAKFEKAMARMGGGGGGGNGGGGSGGGGSGGRSRFSDAEMHDRNFRPPNGTHWPFKYFCSHHGHSTTHSDAGCYHLHPELQTR